MVVTRELHKKTEKKIACAWDDQFLLIVSPQDFGHDDFKWTTGTFCKKLFVLPYLRGYGTLKYGDAHEKFNFSEMQELRPLRTCQKHFETILPNFLLDECEIQGKYSVV